ncbi:MAG: hypothetical protein CM15mP120_03560 [Pseudomonadota bacterium]|nr:MAG: hypothetical protein CM15mP120_03560 [Pseudomonadota bacterium]
MEAGRKPAGIALGAWYHRCGGDWGDPPGKISIHKQRRDLPSFGFGLGFALRFIAIGGLLAHSEAKCGGSAASAVGKLLRATCVTGTLLVLGHLGFGIGVLVLGLWGSPSVSQPGTYWQIFFGAKVF